MTDKKVGIIAECVCDLPKNMLREYGIDIVYFLIETDTGVFMDTAEVTAENILDYMDAGGTRSRSDPPSAEVYHDMFVKNLKRYDELIIITISSGISNSYAKACEALSAMEDQKEKIHIFDSWHLSTGLGFLVLKAGMMASEGASAEEILKVLDEMRSKVCTSFITKNADYLYQKGLVSLNVKRICNIFSIHPILYMKNGKLKLKTFEIGDYEASVCHYVKKIVRNEKTPDTQRCFLTHAGCSVKMINTVTNLSSKVLGFKDIIVTKASATISSNCGRESLGILFVKK